MLTRRHFISTTSLLFSAPIATAAFGQTTDEDAAAILDEVVEEPVRQPVSNSAMWSTWDARVTPANYDPATSNPWGFHPRF